MDIKIINTYDQLRLWKEAGLTRRPVAISPAYMPARTSYRSGWHVWSPFESTDKHAAWYHDGKKHFSGFDLGGSTNKENRQLALVEAMKWANDNYGPFNWVRNRMGDYVPAEINKMFPLPKRKKGE